MFILLLLIMLHGPDGYEVEINPEQVTALRPERHHGTDRHYPPGAKCLISLTDGKNLAVKEDCNTVQQMIDKK